uniref:Uncharacterized protein ycf23 n=1 Tax=Symphyocladiella dendroidea TaxID=2506487 RepID=A0A1Z1M6W4_9FLOR|nr:hypothetical protein [Symphyocladiella dendroidea]ARW61828.1 hypothetical protein [Symphyocladiella dendroidea]
MNLSNVQLHNSFQSKNVIKVITGIHNTNIYQIAQIAKAADLAKASYLDVIANTKVVKFLKSFSSLPLCISSIDPIDIYNCISAGADLVEIGNYDTFYNKGVYITSFELVELIKEVKYLVGDIDLCVTIPYYFDLNEQIRLAQLLECLGVNIVQTEGIFTHNIHSLPKQLSVLTNSLSSSLLSTYFISKSVNIPVITSSGISSIFASTAINCGASGIGIGSAIRGRHNIVSMTKYLNEVKHCMFTNRIDLYQVKDYISINNISEQILSL